MKIVYRIIKHPVYTHARARAYTHAHAHTYTHTYIQHIVKNIVFQHSMSCGCLQ